MRGLKTTALAVALTVVTAASAATGNAEKPSARFVRLSPATVRGAHFIPREKVRVTLRAGTAKRIRTTRTSASGRFTVWFGMLRERDRCGTTMTIVAVGGRGDRAVYRLPPRECPVGATTRQDD